MPDEKNPREHCGFCRKPLAETRLIAGAEASICPDCVRQVCAILGFRIVEEVPSESEEDDN